MTTNHVPSRPPSNAGGAARWIAALLVPALLAAGAPRARGEDPLSPGEERERTLNASRREAIRRGCEWIAGCKNKGGSFGEKAQVAITALSTLALMAGGSGMSRGPHGKEVAEGVDFLLLLVEEPPHSEIRLPPGYFKFPQDNTSRMHGQGYATLALASALASADEKASVRIRRVLQQAVRCAEDSQTATGGWGYDPSKSQEHEGSVTVTVVQGLRAAHDAGLRVSGESVAHGLRYLRNSQKADGSFKYSIQQDRSTYALTAAALSSFYLLGHYVGDPTDKERIDNAVRFLKRRLSRQLRQEREWQYYGHFYAAWAAWQTDGGRSSADGPARWSEDATNEELDRTPFWGPWHSTVYETLVRNQGGDGHWHDETDKFEFGDLLATAFAVLTLAIPDELLPIFQR